MCFKLFMCSCFQIKFRIFRPSDHPKTDTLLTSETSFGNGCDQYKKGVCIPEFLYVTVRCSRPGWRMFSTIPFQDVGQNLCARRRIPAVTKICTESCLLLSSSCAHFEKNSKIILTHSDMSRILCDFEEKLNVLSFFTNIPQDVLTFRNISK